MGGGVGRAMDDVCGAVAAADRQGRDNVEEALKHIYHAFSKLGL